MSRKSRATTKTLPGPEVPVWFDPDKHRLTANGIVSIATGHFLAADGHPQSGPARVRSLAAAGEAHDALGLVSDEAVAAAARRLGASTAPSTTPVVPIEPPAGDNNQGGDSVDSNKAGGAGGQEQ